MRVSVAALLLLLIPTVPFVAAAGPPDDDRMLIRIERVERDDRTRLHHLGIPVVGVLTWFHGRKGPQKVERAELMLLGAALLLWVIVGATILFLF